MIMGINEALSAQARSLRQDQGLTQEEVAERSGLSVDYVEKIERGTTSPTVETVRQLAQGLGVRISTLFDLYEEDLSPEDSQTALVELTRYLRSKSVKDVRFAYSIIRQILER